MIISDASELLAWRRFYLTIQHNYNIIEFKLRGSTLWNLKKNIHGTERQ